MREDQITAGFSDIKNQFFRKMGLDKNHREIRLWFIFNRGVLSVHEYENHEILMVLGSYAPLTGEWNSLLIPGSLGENLVTYLRRIVSDRDHMQKLFNDQYLMSGYFPARQRT